jgi:hypothetical protein
MRKRKTTWSRLLRSVWRVPARVVLTCVVGGTTCWRAAVRRLRRPGPTVIVDVRRRQARRLRREVARAGRTYARALGAEVPPRLLIVVQRVVYEGRQLNGLLQAFDAPDGSRRYVVHLALSINGRQVSEDELLAALRHQLSRALEDVVGKPVLTVPLDLEVPRVRARAPIVELRPDSEDREDGQERSAVPFQRVQDDQAS